MTRLFYLDMVDDGTLWTKDFNYVHKTVQNNRFNAQFMCGEQ